MLSGRIFCPVCGHSCSRAPSVRFTGERGCPTTACRMDTVEEAVLTSLLDAVQHPKAWQVIAAYREPLPAPEPAGMELPPVEAELAALEARQ